jgi:hypothetical protein
MAWPPAEPPGGRPRRPTFEPYARPTPPPGLPPPTPRRPDRDPLRAMAPVFATLAAIGVTALAIWLPVREAQDEELKHYPSTAYIDVPRGATRAWHNVTWRLTYQKRIPWKYYTGASPPPGNFARLHLLLHATLTGPKARLNGLNADTYLHGGLSGETFDYEMRDHDERVWEPFSLGTNPRMWSTYRAANGLDLDIYVDVPPSKVGTASLVVKYKDHRNDLNFSKTPDPRETVLRLGH